MKTDDTNLQPSARLAAHIAPYRDEAPLVSPAQIDEMLAHRDQLPNRSLTTIRKFAMTIAGLSVIALVLYQMFAGSSTSSRNVIAIGPEDPSARTASTPPKQNVDLQQRTASSSDRNGSVLQDPRKEEERGLYSATANQQFIDLTPEELAQLGIAVIDDTVVHYSLNHLGQVSSTKVSTDMIEGSELATPIRGVVASPVVPLIMTQADGHTAAFYEEDSKGSHWGITGDNHKKYEWIRKYFNGPVIPGLRLLRYRHKSYDVSTDNEPHTHWDSVVILIGKDIPELPFANGSIPRQIPDSLHGSLAALSDYYMGRQAKPHAQWPKNFWVRADTVSLFDLLQQLDEEENTPDKAIVTKTLSRLNELIPVLVRVDSKSGKLSSKDFIFWYEPSPSFFAALPPTQASLFQTRSSGPDHCLTAPNSVSKDASITYCSTSDQQAEAIVQDLAGHIIRIVLADAHSGDNTLSIPTEVLPSGIYIVTIQMKDGSRQSRRIWSQNEHPAELPTGVRTDIPPKTEDHRVIYTFPSNYTAARVHEYIEEQSNAGPGKTFEGLDIDSLLASQKGLSAESRAKLRQSMLKAQRDLRGAENSLKTNTPDARSLETSLQLAYIELGEIDKISLGVENDDDLVAYYRLRKDSNTLDMFGILRDWGIMTLTVASSSITHPTPAIYPTIVTDALGRKRMMDVTIPSDTVINQLVPVLFRRPGTTDSIGAKDIIFWYKPSKAFLSALPDSARAIAMEMTGKRVVINAKTVSALRYVRPYPNPSKGSFGLELTMDAPRAMSVIVRNLLGQERVRTLLTVPQGVSTQFVNFSSLEEGIYILEIATDAGESQFERIVIVH